MIVSTPFCGFGAATVAPAVLWRDHMVLSGHLEMLLAAI